MFGASNNNATSGGGLFGNQSTSSNGGFSFGNSNANGAANANGANKNTFSFGNSSTSSPAGLFGNSNGNVKAPGAGGLFGSNSAATMSTPQQPAVSSGNLFGSNNNNNNNNAAGGLFGQKQNTFGANNQGGGLFSNNATSASKPLFGNAAVSTPASTSGGLFGNNVASSTKPLFGNSNSNTTSSSGLFGNSSNQQGSSLFGKSNTAFNQPLMNNATPVKQYNFKDLPKSLTDSTKANKTINLTESSRKRSLSSVNGSAVSQGKSALLEKFGSRFSTIQSQVNYNSEGLFSPKKDLIQSMLRSERSHETNSAVSKLPQDRFSSNVVSSRSMTTPRSMSTDYLKLKINPSRTESRRLKIFGDSGGAKKVRILGKEEVKDSFVDDSNGNAELDQTHLLSTSPNKKEQDKFAETISGVSSQDSEYWCSPSIEELQTLPLRQLAEVPGFTIGRKGYGVIRFELPVDLTAFWSDLKGNLFGNIVKINKNHTVEVYPNGSVPLGTGLNVPAIITLEKVFPITRRKVALSSAEKDIEHRLFVKKLKELKDMEFVTYDPINGSWTFKVQHFSIWGLVEEDDAVVDIEEELAKAKRKIASAEPAEPTQSLKRPTPPAVSKSTQKVMKTNNFAEDTFLYKKQNDNNTYEFDTTSFIPGSFFSPDVDNEEHVEEHNDEINTENILSDSSVDDEEVNAAVPSQLGFDNDDSLSPEDFEMVEKQFEPETLGQQDFDVLDANPSLSISDDWDTQLELCSRYDSVFASDKLKQTTIFEGPFSKNLTAGDLDKLLYGDFSKVLKSNQAIRDELRFSNYSFVEFSASNKLLRQTSQTTSHVSAKSIYFLYDSDNGQFLKSVFRNHLSCSKIVERSNGFPKVAPNKCFDFRQIANSLSYDFSQEQGTVWELASALFDNNTNEEIVGLNDTSVVNRVLEIQRRKALISWIKNDIQSAIDAKLDASNDTFEQIFFLLSSFNISSAAKLAITSNNLHLSVLISLLGSNDPEVKLSAGKQLEVWKRNAVLQTIPSGLVKIYQLLKGDVLATDLIDGLSPSVSWRTKLGLLLSYGDINESLATLIGSFIDSESASIPEQDQTFFNLFKLFVFKHHSIYDISEIFALLRGSKLYDVTLQWYLYEILFRSTKQLSFGADNEFLGDRTTLLFSEELQSMGLWEEALFVLLHLTNNSACESSITRLLSTNPQILENDDVTERLVQQLSIPQSLVSECKALHCRYTGDHWKEAQYLLDAGKYDEAHRVIVSFVAPDAVINNGSKLGELESLISQFPERPNIEGWNIGVSVYKNYLKLVSSKSTAQSPLRFLIESLPLVKAYNFRMNVALQLMSKFVADKLAQLQSKEGSGVLDLDVSKTDKLPLGESDKSAVMVLDRFLKREALSY